MGDPARLPVVASIDLDAFYCGVEIRFDPTLTEDTPFIVAQKNCVATLSYPARAMGLRKLGTVSESLKLVPDIRIVNGENLSKYRSEGKKIFEFVKSLIGESAPAERLGLEEIRMDLTAAVDLNMRHLEATGVLPRILEGSSSQQEVDDDAAQGVYLYMTGDELSEPVLFDDFFFSMPAKSFPSEYGSSLPKYASPERLRFYIGAHLASHIMERIRLDMGYSCSIGVSSNKALAKMVCTVNKPAGLTLLLPEHAQDFMDTQRLIKVPGFGHRTHQVIREHFFSTTGVKVDPFLEDRDEGQDEEPDKSDTAQLSEKRGLSVLEARTVLTEQWLTEQFSKRGPVLWNLLHGIDMTPVEQAVGIPTQISIEDTYATAIRGKQVESQLVKLCHSLLQQIMADLIDDDSEWRTYPTKFRLTTSTTFPSRRSKSTNLTLALYDLPRLTPGQCNELAARVVKEHGMPLYSQLQKPSDFVRMLNVAVTEFASERPKPRLQAKRPLGTHNSIMDRFLSKGPR